MPYKINFDTTFTISLQPLSQFKRDMEFDAINIKLLFSYFKIYFIGLKVVNL